MAAPEALSEQKATSHSSLLGDRLLDQMPLLVLRRLLPGFLRAVIHCPLFYFRYFD